MIHSFDIQVDTIGKTNQLTKLIPNLTGVDPDDAFSTVPYEKGHTLLYYIEHLLGGPQVFEPFLKAYLDKYKYQSIVTSTWKDYLYEYFPGKVEVNHVTPSLRIHLIHFRTLL